jgi:hypothetical protein
VRVKARHLSSSPLALVLPTFLVLAPATLFGCVSREPVGSFSGAPTEPGRRRAELSRARRLWHARALRRHLARLLVRPSQEIRVMHTTSFAPTASQPRPSRPAASPRTADHPTYRCVTTHVTDGLDGVLRVMTVLRGRRYRLRDLSISVQEGVVASTVSATVLLGAQEHSLLLNRLRRVPSVLSAECL